MKKLYRRGAVHPSPPTISDHLSLLPAAVLTLAAALSPEDREVLAYLISCSSNDFSGSRKTTTQKKHASASYGSKTTSSGLSNDDHPPSFKCDCFRCYMSYWVRWDSSPKRQLIHEIIDAIENDTTIPNKTKSSSKTKKDRKRRGGGNRKTESCELNVSEKCDKTCMQNLSNESEHPTVEETCGDDDDDGDGGGGGGGGGGEEEGLEKGSMRKFVSFIGDKIWGVWGQGK